MYLAKKMKQNLFVESKLNLNSCYQDVAVYMVCLVRSVLQDCVVRASVDPPEPLGRGALSASQVMQVETGTG